MKDKLYLQHLKTCTKVAVKNLTSKKKRLTLFINSPGGNLYDAFALIDIMRASRLPIDTVGIGAVIPKVVKMNFYESFVNSAFEDRRFERTAHEFRQYGNDI